jgi:predicted NBD/HSP70 family sugar kinase
MHSHNIKKSTSSAPVTRGPAYVRQGNEWAIYQHLLHLAPASSPQLAESTGLSKVTVSAALNNMERLGLVEQSGVRAGNAGRAPRLFGPRAEAGFVVAVDVGGEWIRGALADLTGAVVVRLEQRTSSRAARLVPQIVDLVATLLSTHGIVRDDVLVTVLGSPGVLNPREGRLKLAANLPGWERSKLVPSLREALGEDILIENDINLAALGEQKHGIGRGVDNFVYLSVGTGIGLGIVADGKLHRGAHGFAGEIAVLPPSPEGHFVPEPDAHQRGLFEAASAAKAIVAHARELGLSASTAQDVFDAARGGDLRAGECVTLEARKLAWALASVVAILDPSLVVLGGGIGRNGDLLLAPLRARLDELVPIPLPAFETSTLGTNAVVLGAIEHGLDRARLKAFERVS